MTETITIGDEKFDLDGNPTLGTVREVQNMQSDILLDYLDESDIREMDSLENESEIMQAIVDHGGMEAFRDVQWDRSMLTNVQTISLAADEKFSPDDFENVPAGRFQELLENAEDALGGDANDFFNQLGIGLSLTEEEMNRMES